MSAKGVSRALQDTAGGLLLTKCKSVKVEGKFVAVSVCSIEDHGHDEHSSATITGTTSKVLIEGKIPIRADDVATCGDVATGSSTVRFG